MNLKVALLLFLVLFASAITTLTMAISIPTAEASSTREVLKAQRTRFGIVEPMGDPIDDPLFEG